MERLVRWIEQHPRSVKAVFCVSAVVNGAAAYEVAARYPLLAALNAFMGVVLLLAAILTIV